MAVTFQGVVMLATLSIIITLRPPSATNNTTCGAGYGNYPAYFSSYVTLKGNESYNHFPSPAALAIHAPCDIGGFDFDNGSANGLANFNYSHETWGGAIGAFNATVGAIQMGPNTIAYNIFENGSASCGDGTCGMIGTLTGTGGPVAFYNNVVWNGYNGQINPVTGSGYVRVGGWGFGGACAPAYSNPPNVYANNIWVSAADHFTGQAYMLRSGYNSAAQNCNAFTYRNNDYYALSGSPNWYGIANQTYTSLAQWNAATNDGAVGTNPNFAGSSGGAGTTCYSGSGAPVQPGTIPCPGYQLQPGNTMIGAGLDLTQAPYSLTLPTQDFYTIAVPNGTGTGYNLGADGTTSRADEATAKALQAWYA
jgi:hypothetical protein